MGRSFFLGFEAIIWHMFYVKNLKKLGTEVQLMFEKHPHSYSPQYKAFFIPIFEIWNL